MRAFSLQADAQKDWTLVLDMHFDEEGGSFYFNREKSHIVIPMRDSVLKFL